MSALKRVLGFFLIDDNVCRTEQYIMYYLQFYIQVGLLYLFFCSNTPITDTLMVQIVLFPYQLHFFQYL